MPIVDNKIVQNVEQRKITDDELKGMKEVIVEFNLIKYKLGELDLAKYELMKQYDNLLKKEKELTDHLTKKYGIVRINNETGEISDLPKE